MVLDAPNKESALALDESMQVPPSQSLLVIALPLSGRYALHGQRALVAAQLALGVAPQQIRQEPFVDTIEGLRVQVVDSGEQAQPLQSASMQQLQQDASVVVGALAPQTAHEWATTCQSAEIPFISLANRQDIAQTGSWIFGMPLTLQQQVDALVRWSVQHKGLQRFAILYPQDRYGQQALQALQHAVQQADTHEQPVVVAAESYEPGETTFKWPIRQLVGLHPIHKHPQYESCQWQAAQEAKKGATTFAQAKRNCIDSLPPIVDFDALLLPAVAETVSYIIPALVAQDILVSQDARIQRKYKKATGHTHIKPVQLLGSNLWNNPQLQQRLHQPTGTGNLGEYMEGALFVDGMNWQQAGESGQHFADAFQQHFGSYPSWKESRVYDAVTLAVWALRQATTATTVQQLRQQIQQQLTQDSDCTTGITGPIRFDNDGNRVPALVLFSIQNNMVEQIQQ
ncbi:MAG: penicillin-binding protein activator [Myxococcota bacterium]